ncbi:splicing factor, arginine/serine-rich, putative [Entamoeba invadens IP1]|uniref:Splicing factor, arginine/serine-rich, putative n=1 Tax=Entamoeba invadens IP1 TaxID=370355 RepID=A0A0A1UEU8_ENTIV|nr:splicing factor, arginine/serine-rich, putative [Entamoeba invadens IP1]ELP92460.1 splicing factor, arginine/serine-rich, putative [Entamoeba invadens IP1]|eukprot:XP_004259231.1 splicing factor, arginine/serine-rich, putative [Entamoeba invadens IP1]
MSTKSGVPRFLSNFMNDAAELNLSVIVGNVSPKVTIEDLYGIFENFGEIVDIKQIKTVVHPQVSAYFLIIYETSDSANTTQYINNSEICGLDIVVYLLSDPSNIQKVSETFMEEVSNVSQPNCPSDQKVSGKLRKTVCVRNIGNLDEQKLIQFFEKCGNIRLLESSAPEVVARQVFIEFETEESALRALQLDGANLAGRVVRVSVSNKTIRPVEKETTVSRNESRMANDILGMLEKKVMEEEKPKKPEVTPMEEESKSYSKSTKEKNQRRSSERRSSRSRSHSRTRSRSDGRSRERRRESYETYRNRGTHDRYERRESERERRSRSRERRRKRF